jgi:malate dehydrogenase (oxaloacetate-decarboxylating)
MRIHLPIDGDAFAEVAGAISRSQAILGAIDLVQVGSTEAVRDITIACADAEHATEVVQLVGDVNAVRVDSVSDRTFLLHKGARSR